MAKDLWEIVKSRKVSVSNGVADDLWTQKNKVAPKRDMSGRVTVRPTEFELNMPFFDKNLRDVLQNIPGAHLAATDTWTLPIGPESVAEIAKLLHEKEIYMVDWVELERDPALQKERSPNSWGAVGVKDHGVQKKGVKKGKGYDSDIDAAKSEDEETDLEKSARDPNKPFFRETNGSDVTEHRIVKHGSGFNKEDRIGKVGGDMRPWTTAQTGFKSREEAIKDMAGHVALANHMASTYGHSKVEVMHRGLAAAVKEHMARLPYRQQELETAKSEEVVEDLEKSKKHKHAHHPHGSSPCTHCGGLGYYFNGRETEDANEPEDNDADDVANATPATSSATVPVATKSQDDALTSLGKSLGLVLEEEETAEPVIEEALSAVEVTEVIVPIEKSIGQFCFSCEKSAAQGATFNLLPDSAYCDNCVSGVRTRR